MPTTKVIKSCLLSEYKNIKTKKDFEKAVDKCITSKKKKSCKKYKVTAGRTIICEDTGKEVFSVTREEGFSPTEADALCHYIVDNLNKKKDFSSYYKKYMK